MQPSWVQGGLAIKSNPKGRSSPMPELSHMRSATPVPLSVVLRGSARLQLARGRWQHTELILKIVRQGRRFVVEDVR